MLKYRKMSTFNADWGAAAVMEGQPPAPVKEVIWHPRMWERPDDKPARRMLLDPEYPPGAHLWELVFHYLDSEERQRPGVLLAYEHVDGVRTGMVALLRIQWNLELAETELDKLNEQNPGWRLDRNFLETIDFGVEGDPLFFRDAEGLRTRLPWED